MYSCVNCDYSSSKKLGKCPECGEFGTFLENKTLVNKKEKDCKHSISEGEILKKKVINTTENSFLNVQNTEFQRIFTNGIKKGGMYLLGGSPGIGKSTLILQIISDILENNKVKIGYFTGEEQESQIFGRRERLMQSDSQKLNKYENIHIFHTTHLEDIFSTSQEYNFDFIVIDSVQTIYTLQTDSSAGSPNQVKYCSEKISEFCKKIGITSFIIGHVTKGGEIAGPKYLEHIVDVVLYLEGDRFGQLRFLRSQKNRFGNTDDSGIFEMTLFGLQPVYDLKDRIIKNANTSIPGSVFTIGLDNGRPVLTTVEVLINKTNYKFPQKNCIGVSAKRVDLVVAILERYLKINLSLFDIFVNVPGEFSFMESGLDLAIAVAIYSQYSNNLIEKNKIFLGELGLGGQLVKTKLHDKRKREVPDGFECIDYNSLKNIVELRQWI